MKMSASENGRNSLLDHSIKVALILQSIAVMLVFIGILGFGFFEGGDTAFLIVKLKAAMYGSLLAIAGTMLSARSVKRSSRIASETSHSAMVPIFSGLLNKLVIVGGGIAFGLIVLELKPIFTVTGYCIVQMAATTQLVMNKALKK